MRVVDNQKIAALAMVEKSSEETEKSTLTTEEKSDTPAPEK